jgi:hypothetical protein
MPTAEPIAEAPPVIVAILRDELLEERAAEIEIVVGIIERVDLVPSFSTSIKPLKLLTTSAK